MTRASDRGPVSRRAFLGGAAAIGFATAAGADQQSMRQAAARRGELLALLTSLVRVRSLSGESAKDAQEIVLTI